MLKRFGWTVALTMACAFGAQAAELTALVVSEPTSRKDVLMLSLGGLESGLNKLLGQDVKATLSEDLTDAMRATRSHGFDIFIGPAQVAASALGHGYELVGATDAEEQYLLVGTAALGAVGDVRRGRVYLPQQDSIYTYLARGMLTASGLSFKDLRQVEYGRYPQAGLTAIDLRLSEATVVRRTDWEAWTREHPGRAKVLASSGEVPGGFSVVVRKDLPADARAKLAKWFRTASPSCGLKVAVLQPESTRYTRVAELGTFTPTSLPGATVVGAAEAQQLVQRGAVIVDTRNDKEFKARHIPGAVFVPYHEKSLKDVAYEGAKDDFSGLSTLDPAKPTIFHCNGPECWKSYKASKAALAKGFAKVYWFRGGMPAWEAAGLQTAQETQ